MDINDIVDDLPVEPLVIIDIDSIDKQAQEDAYNITKDVTALFQDEAWMNSHPTQVKRIKIEIESLRGLVKMRRSDEQVHDALLQAIQSAPTNASLYRALSEVQKTSLAITTKINETIKELNELMKSFQLTEMSVQETIPEEDGVETRGSKEFIKQMLQ